MSSARALWVAPAHSVVVRTANNDNLPGDFFIFIGEAFLRYIWESSIDFHRLLNLRGCGRLTAASFWLLSKAIATGLLARPLARTERACSPLHGTRPRDSGRLTAASSWPVFKATPAGLPVRSFARTVGACSLAHGTRPRGSGLVHSDDVATLTQAVFPHHRPKIVPRANWIKRLSCFGL
jgi:hypothetical protein